MMNVCILSKYFLTVFKSSPCRLGVQIESVYQKNVRTVNHPYGDQIALWMNVAVAGLTN
jgi:hypothetical protein